MMIQLKSLVGLLIFTVFVVHVASAQEDDNTKKLNSPRKHITPSPSVSSLGSYGGVDLKRSTGGVQKNIPLFQLQQGMIKYNPSLEYFSTGVQVDDWGGRQGISWSDNFTATIQRSVATVPDEYANRRMTAPVHQYFQFPGTEARYNDIVAAEWNDNLAHGVQESFDPEYDVFSFNIFGRTGQFIIMDTTAVLLTHREETKIEVLGTSPTYSFCITDLDGIRYYFENEIEYTSLGVNESVTPQLATAWFISRIVSPLSDETPPDSTVVQPRAALMVEPGGPGQPEEPVKDELRFVYHTVSYGWKSNFYQGFTYKRGQESGDDIPPDDQEEFYLVSENDYGISRSYVQTKVLDSVVGDNFRLAFRYTTPREDLVGDKLLNEIRLLNGQDEVVSRVTLNYDSYLASNQLINPWQTRDEDLYPWIYNSNNRRYFLKQVTIGLSSSGAKIYNFSYLNPQNLPPRFSLSQDEGGYFNGIANTWFLPRARVQEYTKHNAKFLAFPMNFTGDRKTTEASKTGILTKITYPTGGADEIEYELNSYTTLVEQERATNYSGQIYTGSGEGSDRTPEEFDWVSFDRATIELSWHAFIPGSSAPPQGGYANNYAWFSIITSGSGTPTFYVDGEPYTRYKLQSSAFEQHLTIIFESDGYTDIGLLFNIYGKDMNVRYELRAGSITTVQGDLPLPGLRVKKVTSKSLFSPDIVATYSYKNFTHQGNKLIFSDVTSSHSVDISDTYIRRNFSLQPVSLGTNSCVGIYYYGLYSSALARTSVFSGGPIAYSCVTEFRGEAFTAGVFDVAVSSPGTPVYGDDFPLIPKGNYAWNNGLELRRYEGTRSSSEYVVVKEQQWDYDYQASIAVENGYFHRRYSEYNNYRCVGVQNYEPFSIVSYYLWKSVYNLKTSKEIFYPTGALGTMTRKTDYQYNTSGLPKRTEETDSRGQTIVTEIRYPENIDAGVYPFMVKDNMLNYPLEQTVKVNGRVTNSTLTTYMVADGNFVPNRIYIAKIPAPISSFSAFDGITMDSHYGFDPELDYISYNRVGKVVKFRERNGVYVFYLWGYHSSHPVAKIETGFNAIISINVDDNRLSQSDEWTTVRDDVTYLKGLLSRYIGDPRYQVTLFTYKPLFGITSQTDPNGLTTYYEYDAAGRLENTRDVDGNILGTYTYHYYNEN